MIPAPRSPWVNAGIVVVATRLIFFTLAYASSYLLSGSTEGLPERGFFDVWVNLDAARFLAVAESGYGSPGSLPHPFQLFPLYPLVVRGLTVIGLPASIAGLFVSALASWVALAFLCKLAEEGAERISVPGDRGHRSMLYLALFPSAVFLVAPYSEALLLAGAVPAFYFARARRWFLVGPFAAIATGAHLAGAFVLIGLVVVMARQRRSERKVAVAVASLFAATLPLLAFGTFVALSRGEWRDLLPGAGEPSLAAPVGVIATLLGAGACMWAVAKKEWGYAAFMGATILAYLITVGFIGPLVLMTFFPMVLFLAEATVRRPRLHETYLVGSATLAAVGVIVYTRGEWFF